VLFARGRSRGNVWVGAVRVVNHDLLAVHVYGSFTPSCHLYVLEVKVRNP
jgi:hypothetical protein